MFTCPKCDKSFTCYKGYHYHLDNKVCETHKIVCTLCGKYFAAKQNLTYHLNHMVSDRKVFIHKPKKTIIDQIIEDKRSILSSYVDEDGEQLNKF